MRSFGTAMNHEFGETDETGILVSLRDLVPEKRKRYIESYDTKNRVLDRLRLFRINMKEQPWWKQINESERTELKRLKHLKETAEKNKSNSSANRLPAAYGLSPVAFKNSQKESAYKNSKMVSCTTTCV